MSLTKSIEYSITKKDKLLRKITRIPSHIKNGRVTSACFKTKPNEDGLSVDVWKLIEDIKTHINERTHTGATISAELPMSLGYECKHVPKDYNYAHSLIVGNTNPIAKILANNCIPLDKAIFPRKI